MGCTKRTAVLMIRHSSRQCSHALYLRIYSNFQPCSDRAPLQTSAAVRIKELDFRFC